MSTMKEYAPPSEAQALIMQLKQQLRKANDRIIDLEVQIDTMCSVPVEDEMDGNLFVLRGCNLTMTQRKIVGFLYTHWKKNPKTPVPKTVIYDALYSSSDKDPDLKIIEVWLCKIRQRFKMKEVPWTIETVWGEGVRLAEVT